MKPSILRRPAVRSSTDGGGPCRAAGRLLRSQRRERDPHDDDHGQTRLQHGHSSRAIVRGRATRPGATRPIAAGTGVTTDALTALHPARVESARRARVHSASRAVGVPRRVYRLGPGRTRIRSGVDAAAHAAPRSHHRRRQRGRRRLSARARRRRGARRPACRATDPRPGAAGVRRARGRRGRRRDGAALRAVGAVPAPQLGLPGRRARDPVCGRARAGLPADGAGAGDCARRHFPAGDPRHRRRVERPGAADGDALCRQHRRRRRGRAAGRLRADPGSRPAPYHRRRRRGQPGLGDRGRPAGPTPGPHAAGRCRRGGESPRVEAGSTSGRVAG